MKNSNTPKSTNPNISEQDDRYVYHTVELDITLADGTHPVRIPMRMDRLTSVMEVATVPRLQEEQRHDR